MIGAYAFTANDWMELDYPLDLWLKWNSKFFDQISLATYGKLIFDDLPKNVKVSEIPSKLDKSSEEYIFKGKSFAQSLLDTEWKVMLDIDEFVKERIETSRFNKKKAYAIRDIHLFGNLETEILNAFPQHYFRIHYGHRRLDKYAGSVAPPYAAKINFGNVIYDIIYKLTAKNPTKSIYTVSSNSSCEVWHTNALRRPTVMKNKWILETASAINSAHGDKSYEEFLSKISISFSYGEYKKFFPTAKLKKVNLKELPDVFIDNSQRFNHYQFDSTSYI